MFATLKAPIVTTFLAIAIALSFLLLTGCSTPAQQQANAEIAAVNRQEATSPQAKTQAYLGGYGPSDPPRLSTDAPYDPLNPELSETVGVPFLSFLTDLSAASNSIIFCWLLMKSCRNLFCIILSTV